MQDKQFQIELLDIHWLEDTPKLVRVCHVFPRTRELGMTGSTRETRALAKVSEAAGRRRLDYLY